MGLKFRPVMNLIQVRICFIFCLFDMSASHFSLTCMCIILIQASTEVNGLKIEKEKQTKTDIRKIMAD